MVEINPCLREWSTTEAEDGVQQKPVHLEYESLSSKVLMTKYTGPSGDDFKLQDFALAPTACAQAIFKADRSGGAPQTDQLL